MKTSLVKQPQPQRRLAVLASHLVDQGQQDEVSIAHVSGKHKDSNETVTVTNNKTGASVTIPIVNGTISATALQSNGLSLRSYDPGFRNTAIARSNICLIDGEKGILRYRGYDIEELAEKSTFLEVAFLLINGELPGPKQLQQWEDGVLTHTQLHTDLVSLIETFRYDAHPMGIVCSSLAALSTFYPEQSPALQGAHVLMDPRIRNKQIFRILGKVPTIAAMAYRIRTGRPPQQPVNHLSYTENFLYMLDHLSEENYRPNPTFVSALNVLWILHAEHGMNASTAAMRHVSSSNADVYTALSGACATLFGPAHGGATEACVRMLQRIGSVEAIPEFIERVKQRKERLMGFGHRVYRTADPRAALVRRVAFQVFDALGEKSPLIDIALALEKAALSDPYFQKRRLFPNVDFFSGIIYFAMGIPTDFFVVMFAIPRVAGWLAHWVESLDSDRSIFRPRQMYTGVTHRYYESLELRSEASGARAFQVDRSRQHRRRELADYKYHGRKGEEHPIG